MSRIGKKPIPIPKGVTVKVEGNTVKPWQGAEGQTGYRTQAGVEISIQQKDGIIVAARQDDSQAALHGSWRARW